MLGVPGEENASSVLLKRNREIAESRDDLRLEKERLDGLQAKNRTLLEDASKLDSEVFKHSSRAAVAEQRLAELLDAETQRNDMKSEMDADHSAGVATLHQEVDEHIAIGSRAKAEAEEERRRADNFEAEVLRWRRFTSEEEAAGARTRTELEDRTRWQNIEARTQKEADDILQQKLTDIDLQRDAHSSEASQARQKAETLKCELDALLATRDDLTKQMERATVRKEENPRDRVEQLSLELTTRGIDPRAVTDGDPTVLVDRGVTSRAVELASELKTSEDQNASLKASLQRARQNDEDAMKRLTAKLDVARDELQASIKDAAQAHGVEVAKLEDEVQAERQREHDELSALQACKTRIEQQRRAKSAAMERQGAALMGSTQEAGRCADLQAELRSTRDATVAAEQRLQLSRKQRANLELRRQKAEEEGAKRVAKVRDRIEELWSALRLQAQAVAMQGQTAAMQRPYADGRAMFAYSPRGR